jgi:hypothetical protein
LYRRFAALVSYGAQLIKSKLDDLTTCFDQWALSPDPTNNSRFVPQKQNAPYRRYLCPETACFSMHTALQGVAQHCRSAHSRNIVYVDDEDRFTLPNFNGQSCALVCATAVIAMMCDADAKPNNFRTHRFGNFKFDECTCPLEEAIFRPSYGSAIRLTQALDDMTDGRYDPSKPQTIRDTS